MSNITVNADDFVTLENVPIFHECVSADGKPVDAEKIELIARINNERTAAGEPAVIHIGHNDGSDTEKPILGFLENYTTGIRKGLRTLFATYRVFKEKAAELRYYPRRSVEIYQSEAPEHKRWVIPSIALVGSNEPALKLGVMYTNTDQRHLAKFTLQNAEPQMLTEEMEQAVLEVLAKTDVFAWAHEQMKAGSAMQEEQGAEPSEQEIAATGQENGEGLEKKEEVESSGESAAEGENPKEEKDAANESTGESEMEDAKKEKEKYTALEQENAELKKKYRNLDREKKLIALEAEGHVFTVAEELADTDDMTDAQFDRHLVRIQKYTKRAPLGKAFNVAGVYSGGEPNQASVADRLQRVKQYALQHKCTFQQAWSAVPQ